VDTEGLRTGRMGRGLEAGADLYGHIVNNRRNILRQVVDCNFVNLGRRVGRLQDGPPLYEARCWNIQARIFAKVNSRPGSPVAIRIINVAAAGKKLEITMATHFCTAQAREYWRIW